MWRRHTCVVQRVLYRRGCASASLSFSELAALASAKISTAARSSAVEKAADRIALLQAQLSQHDVWAVPTRAAKLAREKADLEALLRSVLHLQTELHETTELWGESLL
jgi:uncharacterized protein (DUF1800 family)